MMWIEEEICDVGGQMKRMETSLPKCGGVSHGKQLNAMYENVNMDM